MSSELAAIHSDRKRELYATEETPEVTALPTAKRQKLKRHQQENFPPSFWDNLSRLFLTTRSLREFDRRTVWPSSPVHADFTGAEQVDPTKLIGFAEEGGPNLQDLRAYPRSQEANVDRESSSDQPMPTVAAKTSAYDPSFQQHLIDHGCYPTHHPDAAASVAAQPQNFTAIFTRLGMPTASSSALTMQNFYDFLNKNKQAATEKTTMSGEIRKLAGDMNIPFLENVLFNKIASLIMDSAGKESTLRRPKVDSYDGNIPTGLAKSVRDSLGTYIVPCEATDRPCLPNFFLEAKGKSGDSDVVMRQAWYAGCLGARGVHELRAWIDPNTLEDNNAYTIACSYEAGNATLIVYTIHPRLSSNKHHRRISSMPNRRYEYIMSQLYAINMRNNLAGFVEGMKIYQNARVWAKEQRDRLYAAANLKASSQDTASSESSSQESADELGMDGASS